MKNHTKVHWPSLGNNIYCSEVSIDGLFFFILDKSPWLSKTNIKKISVIQFVHTAFKLNEFKVKPALKLLFEVTANAASSWDVLWGAKQSNTEDVDYSFRLYFELQG